MTVKSHADFKLIHFMAGGRENCHILGVLGG